MSIDLTQKVVCTREMLGHNLSKMPAYQEPISDVKIK